MLSGQGQVHLPVPPAGAAPPPSLRKAGYFCFHQSEFAQCRSQPRLCRQPSSVSNCCRRQAKLHGHERLQIFALCSVECHPKVSQQPTCPSYQVWHAISQVEPSERMLLNNRLPRMSPVICNVFGVRSSSVNLCFVECKGLLQSMYASVNTYLLHAVQQELLS